MFSLLLLQTPKSDYVGVNRMVMQIQGCSMNVKTSDFAILMLRKKSHWSAFGDQRERERCVMSKEGGRERGG